MNLGLQYIISSMSKSKLNIYCQKSRIRNASYNTVKEGDLFVSEVTVGDATYKSVRAYDTKKEAEHDAATVALQGLVRLHSTAASVDDLLATLEPGTKLKKGSTKDSATPEPISSVIAGSNPSASPVGHPMSVPLVMLGHPPPPIGSASRGGPFFVQGSPYAPHGVIHSALVGFHSSPPPGIPVPLSIPFHHSPPAAAADNLLIHPQAGAVAQAISPSLPGRVPIADPGSLNSVPITQRPDHREKRSVSNFEEELENYCLERGLHPPIYSIHENRGSYSGKVVVGGVEYMGSNDQSSFIYAKKSAAVVALANIGLQALRLQEQGIGFIR